MSDAWPVMAEPFTQWVIEDHCGAGRPRFEDARAELGADADPVGPLAPPLVRVARVRDLTTWNDREHRTREDVLGLLDRTVARVSAPRPRVGA